MAYADEVLRKFYTEKASGSKSVLSPSEYYKGQLLAEAGNAQNNRKNSLDQATLGISQQSLDAQKQYNNQSLANQKMADANSQQALKAQESFNTQALADAAANRDASEAAAKTQMLTNLGTTAATAYGLSGSTMIGDAVKTGVQSVAPSVAEYLGLQTAAQKAASVIPKVAADAASTAGTEAVTQGLSSAGANTAAQGAAQVGSAVGDTMGVTTGEVIKGAASSVGSTVGNVAGKVAVPLAIIAAGNMARQQWGAPDKKWYGEESKSGREKFFDDPGVGLGSNVADTLFGSDSEAARIPSQVGEQFSHYAGGPIGKAFDLDFKGAASELSNAPSTTLQSFGVDKGTSEAVNAALNSPGYVYSQVAEGNTTPALNFAAAPDPMTASASTALSNSGLGTVGDVASAVVNPIGAVVSLFCFSFGTLLQMEDGSEKAVQDIDIMDTMQEGGCVVAVGKALSENIYSYKGILVEGHHAVFTDGEWKRAQDCSEAKLHGSGIVYPIVNENHLIVVDGIVFADMIETPLGWDVSDNDRIDWLNSQTKRNELLRERYDNSSVSETEALRDDVQTVE